MRMEPALRMEAGQAPHVSGEVARQHGRWRARPAQLR